MGMNWPLIAGAGALVLLALAAVALVMRRRHTRALEEEAEWSGNDWNEPTAEAPVETAVAQLVAEPMVVAAAPQHDDPRSAFAWGDASPAAEAPELPEGVEAAPGSRVEAAYIGPTEDNPSLSLKKRLKRAAFFDQREQMVAAGEAVPVDADAGLPETLADPEDRDVA
jgi:hypothetical protein